MKNDWARLLLLLLLITAVTLLTLYRDVLDSSRIEALLSDAGSSAPFWFILMYACASVFFLPGSVLTLLGGALFGPYWGTLYNLTAATLGAMLSFLIARYLAADWVARKAGGRLQKLMLGVETEGWRFVAFTRLVPLFPFNLLNYALGLTRIRFAEYSLATFICMLPGAIAYTTLGYLGREAATGGEDLIQKALLALALLASVLFLPRLIKHLRKADLITIHELKQRLDTDPQLLLLDVRTAADYVGEQGHIAGSLLIPLEQLEQRLDELKDYRDKPVITICRTDRKSAQAARLLTQQGFSHVRIARMGMTDWIKQGFEIEQTQPLQE